MREPVVAYVGLGANLGEPLSTLQWAARELAALPETRVERVSGFYRSAPVDAGGPDFINAVVQVRTGLDGPRLLRALQGLEAQAGRERPYRNAPRTLDLDLLLYGSGSIDSAVLTVPHPRMRDRAFVLRPLAELAPHLVTAADLAAVAGQPIAALPAVSLPA